MQKEREKQRLLLLQEQLNQKANSHYRKVLLQSRGMDPWRSFLAICRENRRAAETLNRQQSLRRALTRWRSVWELVLKEKEAVAQELYCSILVQRTWKAWRLVSGHFFYRKCVDVEVVNVNFSSFV